MMSDFESTVFNEMMSSLDYIDEYMMECEDILIEYHFNTNRLYLEKEIMGSLYEQDEIYLENVFNDAAGTLGAAIIKLAKMIIAKIESFIDTIKNSMFKFKSIKKRVELLERKTNFGSEEIKVICRHENLDLASYKTYDEMFEAFNKACQMASNGAGSEEIQKKFDEIFGKGASIEDANKKIQMAKYAKAEHEEKRAKNDENASFIRMVSALKKYEQQAVAENNKSKKSKNQIKQSSQNASNIPGINPETQKVINEYFGVMMKEYQTTMLENKEKLSALEDAIEKAVDDAENKVNEKNDSENK